MCVKKLIKKSRLEKQNNGKNKKIRGLSSTYNRSRALLPFGTVVKSCRNGINSCSSSNELDAQHVQPHQKQKKTHLQEKEMPVACCRTCHVELRKLELQWQKKEFLAVQIGVTLAEMYSVRFTGTAGAAGLHNKGAERKGQLFHFT